MQCRSLALFCAVSVLFVAGCGEPGSPQPPSLNLPSPIRDLAAQRTGDVVHLTWTSSSRTTDHTTPAGQVIARICRVQGSTPNAPCDRVVDERRPPGKVATYDDILPLTLTSGPPELLTYYVELLNRAQKSAGRSNAAYTADGAAPPVLTALVASVRSEGVVLQWKATGVGAFPDYLVRVERKAQAPLAAKKPAATTSFLAPTAPSPDQLFEVAAGRSSETIDETALFGQSYEYSVQALTTLTVSGHAITVLGQQSSPVTVQTRDIFPPAVPTGLVAAADEQARAIDLSWTADTDGDLAGYYVYRETRAAHGQETPVRVSGPAPLPTPSFHDSDVKPGLVYSYAVSAVDKTGNESAVSNQAEESLPPPP